MSMLNNAFLHVHIFLVVASLNQCLNQCELGREVRTAEKKEAEGFLAE